MSAPVKDEVGVREADLRPDRAIALVVLSRAMLLVLVALGAWSIRLAVAVPAGPDTLALPRSTVVLDAGGAQHSGLLESVVTGIRGTGGRIVELDVGQHVARRAPVRLRVELPARGAGEVHRLVQRVADAGVEDVVPQGVTPVVGGVIVEIAGATRLRSRGGADAEVDARPGLVVIGELVERNGVRLRRLELLGDGSAIRIDVAGSMEDLVTLVTTLEQEYSSTVDFRSFRLRSAAADSADLDLVLELRSAVPGGGVRASGVSG